MKTENREGLRLDDGLILAEVSAAIRHVFSTALHLEVMIGEAVFEDAADQDSESVLALIGWSGAWKGVGMLGCSPRFACRIASLLLCATYDSLSEDVLDAVAEMANMIFGNVKTNLESILGVMDLSVPTVLYGNHLSSRSMVREAILIPVLVEGHTVTVKIHMAPNTVHATRTLRLCVNVDLGESSAS